LDLVRVQDPGVVLREVVERRKVDGKDVDHPPVILIAQDLVVKVHEGRVDEHPGRLRGLAEDEAFGLLAVPVEADRDQHEDARAEDEAALALQAGLAEQVLEAAVRHRLSPYRPRRRAETTPPALTSRSAMARPGARCSLMCPFTITDTPESSQINL